MNNDNIKFVAFLDILGFSALLEKNNIEYIYNLFETIFRNLRHKNMIGESYSFCGEEKSCTDDLSFQMISDSIVIWTNDSSHLSLSTLVDACNHLLYGCFDKGLPLRGGISVGNLRNIKIDEPFVISSVIGDAIIKAHKLEKAQKWMGCIVDQECFDYLNVDWWQVIKGPQNIAIEYEVPFGSFTKKYLSLNWCNWLYAYDIDNLKAEVEKSFFEHNKENYQLNTKNKIENTIAFFEYVLENNLFVDETIR